MARKKHPKPNREELAELEGSRLMPDRQGRVIDKRGTLNRRLLIDADIERGGRKVNWMLHATKGWRRRTVPQ